MIKFFGAILGIVVFLIGVGLVVGVFYQAYGLFNAAPPPIPTPAPTATTAKTAEAAASATGAITASLTDFLKRLLALFAMSLAGAIIASQGSALFFRSLTAAPSLPPPAAPAGSPPDGTPSTLN